MCGLVDSGLHWIEVGHNRRRRLTATGRIASITGRAVEHLDQTVAEIRDVNAVVNVIDGDCVAAGGRLHRRLAAARGVRRVTGRHVDDRDEPLVTVADIKCVRRRIEREPEDDGARNCHRRRRLTAAGGVRRITGRAINHCDRIVIEVRAEKRRVDRVGCRIEGKVERDRPDGYRGDRRAERRIF